MTETNGANPPSLEATADVVAEAAVTLAGKRGWRSLSVVEIAAEAGVTLAELSRFYSCKPEILDGFERMIDRRMLSGVTAGNGNEKPRDRMFEIIMARFDALLPYRDGVRRIARELPFDSASGMVLALATPRTASWMLAGAGIKIGGPFVPLRLAAVSGLYLSLFRTWLEDKSEDMAKTMATLDRRLGQASFLFGGDSGMDRPPPQAPGTAEPLSEANAESCTSAQ